MPERDFNAEFAEMMVSLVAEDSPLVDSLKLRMFERESDVTMPEEEIKLNYGLDDQLFKRALIKTLASLSGTRTAREVLDEQT